MDLKRIGRNIKTIRNANKMNSLDFAEKIGISQSYLEKLESGRKTFKSDETLNQILLEVCKISGVPFTDIKYGDLSFIEEGMFRFDNPVVLDNIDDEEIYREVIDSFATFFPIFSSDEAKRSESFRLAVDIARNKIIPFIYDEKDCEEAIDLFAKSKSEGVGDISSVNILSCLGYLYIKKVMIPFSDLDLNRLYKSKISSVTNFLSRSSTLMDEKLYLSNKKDFFKNYEQILLENISEVKSSPNYSDFAYFYLFARYNFGMFRESQIKRFGVGQLQVFIDFYLKNLCEMGNKYALKFKEYFQEV